MNPARHAYLAFRFFSGHYRRFLFLIGAVSFGFALITVMTSLSRGMYDNVRRAAEEHYGGQLFALGFHKQYGMLGLIEDDAAVQRALFSLPEKPVKSVKRSLFFADGYLYFAGRSSRQKYVYGIDFPTESDSLARLDFIEGAPPEEGDASAILLSRGTARQLGVRAGDDLVLKVRTKTGQSNTGNFTVSGIFSDDSIFGYFKCYVDRRVLNGLMGLNSDDYSSLGLYFDDPDDAGRYAKLFNIALSKELPTAAFPESKEDFAYSKSLDWTGIRHFVMTLDLYVSQVGDLLRAMNLISYFLYIMVTLIVLVSISVTYRLIIHEREGELATMRAMGFRRGDVLTVLMLEAVLAVFISLIMGTVLSIVVFKAIGFISFASIPGIELFLKRGKMTPLVLVSDVVKNLTLLVFIIFPALIVPAVKASRLNAASINN